MSPRQPPTEPKRPQPGFGPATTAWFEARFPAPTAVQARGWPAILRGEHALLCAPTGSGKTLAAFLAAIDRATRSPGPGGVRVLYISPQKALAYDVERNLRAPLEGIEQAAARLAVQLEPVRVAIRTGDTPPAERRQLARAPAEILVTTPESLYLLLGSEARRILARVETVIVDEIHALAPSKRGAHLALSLERLGALVRDNGAPEPQRIGLSATQRPLDEVARFLGGVRPVTIIDAGERPHLDLVVEVPVDELERLQPAKGIRDGDEEAAGIWPALHARVLELILSHRSTIVFTNSRRLCERLARRLNELSAEGGQAEVLVRSHHGSIAREQRVEIEELLKAGRLRGLVATSSLELGIDMGAVDLVIQIESPGSVSRGLQRVGRAGHAVGARSIARLFPKFRHDLLETTVVARRMLEGEVEPIRVPHNALDVLAQQLVAICAAQAHSVEELLALVRGAYSYQTLSRELLVAVLDMLAGRSPADELGELRPRLIWDRATDQLSARKDARLIAIVNAGTIPDRGLYAVHLEGGGPRVGELDEEMVHETRVGQTFLLGSSSWRVLEITRDRVIVRPAPGEPGRMPFWRGEGPGRPIELGRAIGEFVREVEVRLEDPSAARAFLRDDYALDARAADNLCRYLEEQGRATGHLPTDRVLVVERFRDEVGDWRMCLLSPFGARVHAPLALVLEATLAARTGQPAQVLHTNDGIVLRLGGTGTPPSLVELLPTPETTEALLLEQLRGSALFATHFRENAARALLLPRRHPGRRTPLWAQRLKAQGLLALVGSQPDFPIVLETIRECLHDLFDLPALLDLLRQIRAGRLRIVEVETERASPFARGLALAYVASYVYEGSAPLPERRAQALTLDQGLLRELLGEVELRELLDPETLRSVEDELQGTSADRPLRSADALHDLLRRVGDLTTTEIARRSSEPPQAWLATLERSGRALAVELPGLPGLPERSEARYIAIEDAARYRDALGVELPRGLPPVYLSPSATALIALVARYARTHAPFSSSALEERLGIDHDRLAPVLRALVASGQLLEGAFRPDGAGLELCCPEVLRRLRRGALAKLRRQIAPVEASQLAHFLPAWHGIGRGAGSLAEPERLREVLAALEGLSLPFAELEGRILPTRLPGYRPRLLDELGASGELVWRGRGRLGDEGGLVAVYFRDHLASLAPAPVTAACSPLGATILDELSRRGASFFAALQAAAPTTLTDELEAALWELAWAGLVSNDSFSTLRARSVYRTRARSSTRRPGAGRPSPTLAGRWSLSIDPSGLPPEPTACAHAEAQRLLARYGVVTREATQAETVIGGFAAIAEVLRAMEDAGRVRRGYFVEGLAGLQYALPEAIDRLREAIPGRGKPCVLVLSALDPANPYGVFLDWPGLDPLGGHASGRPRRAAGAAVVLVDGAPLLFLEQGGRKLLIFEAPPDRPDSLAAAIAALCSDGGHGRLRIGTINGRAALRSPHAESLERGGFRVEPGGLMLERGPALQ